MTPQQIYLVAQTWSQLRPRAEEFATLFYQRLGELSPGLRRLFPEGAGQSGRMISMLDTVVVTLDLVDNLVPALSAMGCRYAEEGVTEQDYGLAEEAMHWSLEQMLGDTLSTEAQDAWGEAFVSLTSVMCEAAANPIRGQTTHKTNVPPPGNSQADRDATRSGTQCFAGEAPDSRGKPAR